MVIIVVIVTALLLSIGMVIGAVGPRLPAVAERPAAVGRVGQPALHRGPHRRRHPRHHPGDARRRALARQRRLAAMRAVVSARDAEAG